MKSALPSVQIVKVAAEFHSFACRWYWLLSSWVTLLLGPPFWFVVQFVLFPAGGGAGAFEEVLGGGAGGALAGGLDDGGLPGEVGAELAGGAEDALGGALGTWPAELAGLDAMDADEAGPDADGDRRADFEAREDGADTEPGDAD